MLNRGMVDMINKQADTLINYNQNTERKIIIMEDEWVDKYPYKTTPLSGLYDPEEHGFHDRYVGGKIHKIARVKGEYFFILVNKFDNTIGIYIPNDNLEKLNMSQLKWLCKKYKKEHKSDAIKADLIKLLLA